MRAVYWKPWMTAAMSTPSTARAAMWRTKMPMYRHPLRNPPSAQDVITNVPPSMHPT